MLPAEVTGGGKAWDHLGLCGTYEGVRGSGGCSMLVEGEFIKSVISLIEIVSILQELSKSVAKSIFVKGGVCVVMVRADGMLKPSVSG